MHYFEFHILCTDEYDSWTSHLWTLCEGRQKAELRGASQRSSVSKTFSEEEKEELLKPNARPGQGKRKMDYAINGATHSNPIYMKMELVAGLSYGELGDPSFMDANHIIMIGISTGAAPFLSHIAQAATKEDLQKITFIFKAGFDEDSREYSRYSMHVERLVQRSVKQTLGNADQAEIDNEVDRLLKRPKVQKDLPDLIVAAIEAANDTGTNEDAIHVGYCGSNQVRNSIYNVEKDSGKRLTDIPPNCHFAESF